MASNRGVAYVKPGEVKVESIDFPKLWDPTTRKNIEHGVILKIVSTNICGSDQHMVRGRTTAEVGLVLGHEITGEVTSSKTGADLNVVQWLRFGGSGSFLQMLGISRRDLWGEVLPRMRTVRDSIGPK